MGFSITGMKLREDCLKIISRWGLTTQVIRVRSGDTLSKIAMRYRTSVKTLVALNDLKSKNLLRLNQRLLVPTLTTNES